MKGYTFNKYVLLGVTIIICIWQCIYYIVGNAVIMPSPKDTIVSLGIIVTNDYFGETIVSTLRRTIISFGIALMCALAMGIIAALRQWFYDLITPVISLFKTVPTMAIVILALIWLTNEKAPILIATMMVFPVLYEAVIQGIVGIDNNILSMAHVYGVKSIDIINYIYIPNILSHILSIFSSTMGLCLKLVIGGEVLGQPPNSIGTSIQTEKMYLNTAGVLAWIIILVIVSIMMDMLAKAMTVLISHIRKGLKRGTVLY